MTHGVGIIVFRGPSISHQEAASLLPGARILGPAAMGDLLSACIAFRPHTIVLIDGYFGSVLSVFHKEILYALHTGVKVVGAASMGALRAAECGTFGMIGVGKIYQAFANGSLVDDDEVALIHADDEEDFIPMSQAMITIRATLSAAQASGVISEAESQWLIDQQKHRYFPDRSFAGVVRDAQDGGLPADRIRLLAEFMRFESVDPKGEDARLALQCARDLGSDLIPHEDRPKKPMSRHFEATLARDVRPADATGLGPSFDEMRRMDLLVREGARRTLETARMRRTLCNLSASAPTELDDDDIRAARAYVASCLKIKTEQLEEEAHRWDLDAVGMQDLIRSQAHIMRASRSPSVMHSPTLLADDYMHELRLSGAYGEARDAARLLQELARRIDMRRGLTDAQLVAFARDERLLRADQRLEDLAHELQLGGAAQVIQDLDVLARARIALSDYDFIDSNVDVVIDVEPRMARGDGV